MNQIIEENRSALMALCQQFHVREIEVFGSATRWDFDPTGSDLDFLVTFQDLEPAENAEAYFGLFESLQRLFDRPVDLIVAPSIQNPYFLEEIKKTRTLLYAA